MKVLTIENYKGVEGFPKAIAQYSILNKNGKLKRIT